MNTSKVSFELTAEQAARLLGLDKIRANASDGRLGLRHIQLEWSDGKTLEAIATDSYKLAVHRIEPAEMSGDDEGTFTVDGDSFLAALKAIKSSKADRALPAHVTIEGDTMTVKTFAPTQAEYVVKAADVSFPKWRKLMPDETSEGTGTFPALSPVHLAAIIAGSGLTKARQNYPLRLQHIDMLKPVTFRMVSPSFDLDYRGVIMPVRV